MDALSFCFWVHGFDEISGGTVPNATQWTIIQDHLKLVLDTPQPSSGNRGYAPFQLDLAADEKPDKRLSYC